MIRPRETMRPADPGLSYQRGEDWRDRAACAGLDVSGARWFAAKRDKDPMFQAKAVAVAEQCRTIGRLSGAPWFVENPVSVLSRVFGKPSHIFNPCDYTAWEPADNYTKHLPLGGWRVPHARTAA